MLISLAEFRVLVDSVKPRLLKDASPEEVKVFVGISNEPNYQRGVIDDLLFARVKNSFKSGHKNVFNHCRTLLGELVHDHEANDAPRDPYFEILSVLRDAIRGDSFAAQVTGDWPTAVQAAVDYSEWRGTFHTPMYEHMFKAEIQQARAVRRVKAIGKPGRAGDAPKVLPEEQRRVLACTIEKNFIKHMGAAHVAKIVFSLLAPKFDTLQERYHDVDQFSFTEPMHPRLPIGLLLNYAAKYPLPARPKRHGESDWQHLLMASKDFAAVYGVQPSSNMDAIFVDQEGLLPLLRRLSIHDALFSPPQTRPSDVTKIIRGLVSGLQAAGKLPESAAAEVPDLIQVVEALQAVIGDHRGPLKIDSKDVVASCTSIPETKVRTVMRDVLAHPQGSANKNFTVPDESSDDSLPREDRAGPNYGDRPLLTLQQDQYLLLDHSVNSPAIIEAVLARLRQIGLDADIGYGIEGLLHEELSSRSIPTQTGKYTVGGKTWECDIVIETAKRVIFVETKKKSLTRAARSGFDVAILVDMTDSLVSATLQAMRHQLQIKQAGFLELAQVDNSITRIELNEREVECIAVTLPDYGSFQDRIILERILNNGMRLSFSTDNEAFQSKLKKVNKKMDELRDINNDLYIQAGKPPNWQPFFHNWFLSVPQFLVLLDGVSSATEFDDALNLTRHITTGSKDFYFDLHYARKLKAVAGAR